MQKPQQPKTKTRPKVNAGAGGRKKMKSPAWLPWVVAALLVMITGYLYAPSLSNQFTNWDDNVYVLENEHVKLPFSENIPWFFSHSSAGNYHPLTMLSLSLDYQVATKGKPTLNVAGEPDAFPFHTTSMVLHLLNVLLVFVFVWLLSRKRIIVAAATALLFALHPMHVESVAWISERKDVLYSFFFLAGLITYFRYLEKQDWIWLPVTGILFLLSLFSKPAAVIFPLALLAVDYFYGRKFTARVLLEKIPFLILAVVFGMITTTIQGHLAASGIRVFTMIQRIMFASYAFIMYQAKLLLPMKISAYYPYPSTDAAGHVPMIYSLAPFIALALVVAVILSSRLTRIFSFGYLFFFISIMLVLQFVPVGNAIMADRYTYMSSVGLFFIIAWGLDQAFQSNQNALQFLKWIFAGLFLVYALFLGTNAREQIGVWKNPVTLWTDVIAKYPDAYVAYKHRGNYYGGANQVDLAREDYLSFLRIRQDDAAIYNNLGNVYRLGHDTEKAIDAYSKSIAINSLDPKTWLNRGVAYSTIKQYPLAMADFNTALTLHPGAMEIYISRSVMYREMGRYSEAIDDFSRVIADNPRNENYFMDRGFCYLMIKKLPESLADFEQCLVLNPTNGHACYNISALYNEMKDFHKAYDYAIRARSLGYPVDAGLLETLKKKGG